MDFLARDSRCGSMGFSAKRRGFLDVAMLMVGFVGRCGHGGYGFVGGNGYGFVGVGGGGLLIGLWIVSIVPLFQIVG